VHINDASKPGAVLVAEEASLSPRIFFFGREGTYVLERYAAIMDRMSVSLRVVSSNPGVSIRVTKRPLITNGLEVCTSLVQLSRP